MKVKDIHDFFQTPKEKGKARSLKDLLDTIPGFILRNEADGSEELNWTMAQEYYHICQKMRDVLLLVNFNPNHRNYEGMDLRIYGKAIAESQK